MVYPWQLPYWWACVRSVRASDGAVVRDKARSPDNAALRIPVGAVARFLLDCDEGTLAMSVNGSDKGIVIRGLPVGQTLYVLCAGHCCLLRLRQRTPCCRCITSAPSPCHLCLSRYPAVFLDNRNLVVDFVQSYQELQRPFAVSVVLGSSDKYSLPSMAPAFGSAYRVSMLLSVGLYAVRGNTRACTLHQPFLPLRLRVYEGSVGPRPDVGAEPQLLAVPAAVFTIA